MKLFTWWLHRTRIVTIAGRKELALKTDNNNMSMQITETIACINNDEQIFWLCYYH
jgi:hypothetical protein